MVYEIYIQNYEALGFFFKLPLQFAPVNLASAQSRQNININHEA